MSIAIGINAGSYVLIASDVRACDYDAPTGRFTNFSVYEKLRVTPTGLITGCGWAPLLEAVKDHYEENPPATADHFLDLVDAELKVARAEAAYNADAEAQINLTSWLVTYRGEANLNCCVYAVKHGRHLGAIEVGRAMAVVPDIKRQDVKDRRAAAKISNDVIQANLRVSDSEADHLDFNIELIRQVVATAAEMVESISPECQIGVHFDHAIGLTDILKPGEPVTWRD